jgi:glutathione peroxidase
MDVPCDAESDRHTGSSRPDFPRTRTNAVFDRSILPPAFAALAALLIVSSAAIVPAQESPKKPTSVLDFRVKDIDGKDVDLAKYKGKVLLIVNTASQCGLTPQYKDLQAIYEKYKDQGFEVLAFPANEFGSQEPGDNPQIKEFCSTNYKVSFPLFSKIVVARQGIHPLYSFLTSDQTNPKFAGEIQWNFTKFLVNKKGEVIDRFEPKEKPSSEKVTGEIEKALADK